MLEKSKTTDSLLANDKVESQTSLQRPPEEATPAALSISRVGDLVYLHLNRPQALNALDVPMACALAQAARDLAADTQLRAVVISGNGRAFCAGGDLLKMSADPAPVARALIEPLHEAIMLLSGLRAPVLASVHGVVAGAGLSLMLACDLTIAAVGTRFNLAYVNVGTSCDGAASWSLPRVVGLRKALEIALLGETLDATEALRLGLVNRVVPALELEAQTEILAQRLANGPTQALGEIKKLLRASQQTSLSDQLDAEQAAFLRCAGTDDFRSAVDAFLAKRPATFTGR